MAVLLPYNMACSKCVQGLAAPFADIVFAQPQILVEDLSLVQKLKRACNAPVYLLQSSAQTASAFGADDFLVSTMNESENSAAHRCRVFRALSLSPLHGQPHT